MSDMNRKNVLVALACIALAGCAQDRSEVAKWQPDQKLRRQIFRECMAALPAGPQTTATNDWDEVVEACDAVAYRQSMPGEHP